MSGFWQGFFDGMFQNAFRTLVLGPIFWVGAGVLKLCSWGRLNFEFGQYYGRFPLSKDPTVKRGWLTYRRGDDIYVGEYTTIFVGIIVVGSVGSLIMKLAGVEK